MDIQTCKRIYAAHKFALVLVKGNSTVTSDGSGIAPLVELVKSGNDYRGYSAADKIVGKAAALLYVTLGVKYVYGEVMSEGAKSVLDNNGIACEFGTLTENIINRRGDGICPMEQAVIGIDEPAAAVAALSERLEQLKSKNRSET